jgi:rare lipoprotein A
MILQGSNVEVPEVFGWTGFLDVPDHVWFTKFVIRAKTLGIIRGTAKQIFSPSASITYAEALKIMVKLNSIQVPETIENPPFVDVSVDTWYAPYFMVAKNAGILTNSSESVFPGKAMTRGELAQLLYQLGKVVKVQEREIGTASFYRTRYERNHPGDTSSAEAFGTAHKTLPFGTKLKITALDSRKTVIVVVQDRGPYVAGRVVDLSRTAFAAIAPLSQGIVPVIVEQME